MSESRQQTWTAGFLLVTAAAVGIATGLAEAAYMIKQVYLRSVFVGTGRASLWLAPAAEGLLFLLVGLALLLAGRVVPRIRLPHVWMAILTGLSSYSLLVFYDRLHPISNMLLALGLAAAAFRIVRRWSAPLHRVLRWAAPAALALVPLLAVGLHVALAARERATLDRSPAAPPNAMNVLLIVLDTVRAENLSLYGYERPTTPELERLARRGVRFDRAISPTSWTLPAHASMFTGRHPHEHGADWRVPLGSQYPTLAEFLSARGWRTGGFVANTSFCGWDTGLDRGFSHYEDYSVSLASLVDISPLIMRVAVNPRLRSWIGTDQILGRKTAPEVSRAFVRWATNGNDRPFFAFLNYFDAHGPYLPPDSLARRFARGKPRGPLSPLWRFEQFGFPKPSAEVIRQEEAAYDAMIALLDGEIGSLINRLEAANILENTIVIVTSDHGEEFDEHGITGHGNDLYIESLHVPLIVFDPRRAHAPAVVTDPVGLRGLPAMVTAMLGYEESPFPAGAMSESLGLIAPSPDMETRVLSELSYDRNLPRHAAAARGDMLSIIADSLHYIRNGDGVEELFNLLRDPEERRNLAGSIRPPSLLYESRDSIATGAEL